MGRPKGAKSVRWTPAEIKFVRDNHGKMKDSDFVLVFARLGRRVSVWGVRELRYRMGLFKLRLGSRKLVAAPNHQEGETRAVRNAKTRKKHGFTRDQASTGR